MSKKYRINIWEPNGSQPMYKVIMNLISELNESLKTPLMKESKGDEEVRRILDNPEGIRIKELQVIDVWNIGKGLRRELRDELDEAYVFLSTEAAQLIADRNEIGNRSEEGNIGINDENRKLKSTIVNQYEVIEKLIEDYEKKEELSEKERKLLVYIRKVYFKALKEAIKNLFSTASESTERVKIFPRNEQEAITNKINNLQKKIRSLTRKNKQEQKNQQKENYEKFELERKELEKKLTSLIVLKETLNNSFPNLVDSENKINEEVLIRLKEVQRQLEVGEKSDEIIKKTNEKLNNLVGEIKIKTSQGLDWVQIRSYMGEVRDSLKKITTELTNSSNQQLTAQIEQKLVTGQNIMK